MSPVKRSIMLHGRKTSVRLEKPFWHAVQTIANALELFRDQLGKTGQRSLSHFRSRDPDDHRVVRLHHDQALTSGGRAWACASRPIGMWNPNESPAAAELTRNDRRFIRGISFMAASLVTRSQQRRGLPRGPAGRCRTGRCW
jgi:hypothetical protein